ncbi:MAG TPA: hypothetical protein VM101_06865 [Flavitalea sp.]|jgi:RNA recognition motif-containing protein|nr:hypothetical protein [Flavitalea sp.]
MKLFVAGLPYDMDHQDLKEMFELYGVVQSAKVVMDFNTRKSKGFGFVEFEKASEAKEVMELLNGRMIKGKELVVKEAEGRQ